MILLVELLLTRDLGRGQRALSSPPHLLTSAASLYLAAFTDRALDLRVSEAHDGVDICSSKKQTKKTFSRSLSNKYLSLNEGFVRCLSCMTYSYRPTSVPIFQP